MDFCALADGHRWMPFPAESLSDISLVNFAGHSCSRVRAADRFCLSKSCSRYDQVIVNVLIWFSCCDRDCSRYAVASSASVSSVSATAVILYEFHVDTSLCASVRSDLLIFTPTMLFGLPLPVSIVIITSSAFTDSLNWIDGTGFMRSSRIGLTDKSSM